MQTQQKTKERVGGIGEDNGGIPVVVIITVIMLVVAFSATIFLLCAPKVQDTRTTQTIEISQASNASTTQRVGEMQMQRTQPEAEVPLAQSVGSRRADPADKDPDE